MDEKKYNPNQNEEIENNEPELSDESVIEEDNSVEYEEFKPNYEIYLEGQENGGEEIDVDGINQSQKINGEEELVRGNEEVNNNIKLLWNNIVDHNGVNINLPNSPISGSMENLKATLEGYKINPEKNNGEYAKQFGIIKESIDTLADRNADYKSKDKAWKNLIVSSRKIEKPLSGDVNELQIYRASRVVTDTIQTLSQKDIINDLEANTDEIKNAERNFDSTVKEQLDVLDRDDKNYSLFFRVKTIEEINAEYESCSEKRKNYAQSNTKLSEEIENAEKERQEYIKEYDVSDNYVRERNLEKFENDPSLSPKTKDYNDTLKEIETLSERNKALEEESKGLKESIDSRWNDGKTKFDSMIATVNQKISEYGKYHESLAEYGEDVKNVSVIDFELTNSFLGRKEIDFTAKECGEYLGSLEGEDKVFYEQIVANEKKTAELEEIRRKAVSVEERIFGNGISRTSLENFYVRGLEYSKVRRENEQVFVDLMKNEENKKCYDYFGTLKSLSGSEDIRSSYDAEARIAFENAKINKELISSDKLGIYKSYGLYKALNGFSEEVNDKKDHDLYLNISFNIKENEKKISENRDSLDSKKQEAESEKKTYEEKKAKEYKNGLEKIDLRIGDAKEKLNANKVADEKMSPVFEVKEAYGKIEKSLDCKEAGERNYMSYLRGSVSNNNYAYIRNNFRELLATKDFVRKSGSDSKEYKAMIENLQKVSENVYNSKEDFAKDLDSLKASAEKYMTAKKNQFFRRSGSDLSRSRMGLAESISYFADKGIERINECENACNNNKAEYEKLAEKQNGIYSAVRTAVTEKHKELLISNVRKEMELSASDIKKTVDELGKNKTAEDVIDTNLKLENSENSKDDTQMLIK